MTTPSETSVPTEVEAAPLNRLQRLAQDFDDLTAPLRAPFEKILRDLLVGFSTPSQNDSSVASTSTYDESSFTTTTTSSSSSRRGYFEDLKDFF